jgi:UDP-N-acetylmuramoyl-tripeptide--D-alanyl-D-alanine ligase
MVHAVLAAAAVAFGEGIPLASVLPALAGLPPSPGRMQAVKLTNGVVLLRDDYKSSMETVETALAELAEIDARRKIAVLGELSEPPGSQGPVYRKIGERLAAIADLAVLVVGKRAFEGYRAGLYEGGFARSSIIDAKRSALIAADEVRRIAGPGDVVLIKGKDVQRMERVAFALMGKPIRCDLVYCDRQASRCAHCEKLA